MNKDINKRLEELNINIENASVPAGSYIPYVISNNLVFISGQLPFINGELALDFLLLIFILYFLINLCNKDKGIDSK